MSDARQLYDGWVVDHSKAPRNRGSLDGSTHTARADNPLCGDRVTVALTVSDGRITAARFDGRGCAIAIASASLLTTLIEHRTLHEVATLRTHVDRAVDPDADEPPGELACLCAVRAFPGRRRCATLAWEALDAALGADSSP